LAGEGTVLKSEVAGRVVKIFFNSGTKVSANTPLVQLDVGTPRAQVDLSRASLNLTRTDYDRKKRLHQAGVISTAELEAATANYESDQARVAQAKVELGKYYVTAPFDGQLGLRLINLGDYVAAGTEIVSLQNLGSILIDFPVSEKYINALKIGQKLGVSTDTYPNTIFNGEIIAIDSLISPNTQSLMVRGKVNNQDNKLIPGHFVNVIVYLTEPRKHIIIPQTALNYAPDGNAFVYLIMNNRAIKREVTVQKILEQTAIIQKGLKSGDVIVSSGGFKLQNNFPVRITKKN
jgi:membrane fusion protein (multidrug efflux system)